MMRLIAGAALAFAASGCFAASYLTQHLALGQIERLELRRPINSMHRLLTNRGWLIGYASNWVGWALYIGALSLAALSLVQAITASTIGTVALAARRSGRSISRRELVGAALAVVGLIAVLGTTHASSHETRPAVGVMLVFVATALAVVALAVTTVPRYARGVALAFGSGCCYAAGDVATKAAVLGETVLIPVFLTCIALGFVLLQLAYQRASLLASAGLSALTTNAIPIIAGVVLFGESTLQGTQTALRAVGFAAIVLGAVALTSGPTHTETNAVRDERVDR